MRKTRHQMKFVNKHMGHFRAFLQAISFPEHARSQVKGGHSSGEIELFTLNFQREFYACSAIVAKYK
jgi:hypothetical protein